MRNLCLIFLACVMSLVMASCSGSSSSDKKRIAELEAQLAELKSNNSSSTEEESSYASSGSTTSSTPSYSQSSQSVVGTYEFSDNINTWVLVVEKDDDCDDEGTAYIYNKSKGEGVKCYGSWYKYSHMKFADLSFSEKAPIVFFPSQEKTLYNPYISSEWIYYNSSAADAKNPNLRLKLKKIK